MFGNTDNLDEAFSSYFGTPKIEPTIPVVNTPGEVITPPDYTYENYKEGQAISSTDDTPAISEFHMLSEDNIDDVDELAEKIRLLLNAAWGDNWGAFSSEAPTGDNPEDIPLPQITYDVYERAVQEKKSLKPTLFNSVKEIVNGKPTGDAFNVYRQFFECTIEFNIWGTNNLEARRLMKKFETVMSSYAGYLKNQGLSDIFFLKEMSSRQSEKYIDHIPMRSLLYLVKLERITVIRHSTLKKMELALQTKQPVSYFVGKTPTDKNINNNITYKL